MTYYSHLLSDYGLDSFSMTLNADNIALEMNFIWPTDIQKCYDDQVLILDGYFKNISYFQLQDPDTYFQLGYSAAQLDMWQQFLQVYDKHDKYKLRDILNQSAWPVQLRDYVMSLDESPWFDDDGNWIAPQALYTNIKYLIDTLQPQLDYMAYLDTQLYWRIYIRTIENDYVVVLHPNCWMLQGFSYVRLYAESTLERIGRDQIGQIQLYAAVGEGDVV